jgi:hypothetical protein
MTTFVMNPLSVSSQFHTSKQVSEAVEGIVDCFEHLLPALSKNIHTLIYDARLEQSFLIPGQDFHSSINDMVDGKNDAKSVKKLWYIYTRNRAVNSDWEPAVDINVACPKTAKSISGLVSEELLVEESHWLSFPKVVPLEEPSLIVTTASGDKFLVTNSNKLQNLEKYLPIYEKSAKHRLEPYFDSAGDYVSPMTLPDHEAQNLLLLSVLDSNDRISFHFASGKYYRFKLTRLNIYHGFEIKAHEVSAATVALLR